MARKDGKDRGMFERPKGSGVWWIEWHDHLGQRHREKVGAKSDARNLYRTRKSTVVKIRKGLENEAALQLKPDTPLTFAEFIESITPELEQKKSWRDDKRFCENWTRLIGSKLITEVSATHAVRRRTARLAKGLKPGTINRETAFLKMALNKAVRDGHISTNPLSGFKLLKENNEQDRYLTESEEQRLQEVMSAEDFELIAFAVDTGMRQREQFQLAWTNVNFDDRWMVLEETKGGRSRSVPFTSRVETILRRRHAQRNSAWVFPNQGGTNHLQPSDFMRNVFRPALAAAQIERLTWHNLRHTTATRMIQRGVTEAMVGALLGHSSSKTTKRYTHHSPDSLRKAILALEPGDGKGGLRVVR